MKRLLMVFGIAAAFVLTWASGSEGRSGCSTRLKSQPIRLRRTAACRRPGEASGRVAVTAGREGHASSGARLRRALAHAIWLLASELGSQAPAEGPFRARFWGSCRRR